jgi:hypothetical protein
MARNYFKPRSMGKKPKQKPISTEIKKRKWRNGSG